MPDLPKQPESPSSEAMKPARTPAYLKNKTPEQLFQEMKATAEENHLHPEDIRNQR